MGGSIRNASAQLPCYPVVYPFGRSGRVTLLQVHHRSFNPSQSRNPEGISASIRWGLPPISAGTNDREASNSS